MLFLQVKNSWLLRIKESKAKEAAEVKKTIGSEIDEFLTAQRQESDLQQQSTVNVNIIRLFKGI